VVGGKAFGWLSWPRLIVRQLVTSVKRRGDFTHDVQSDQMKVRSQLTSRNKVSLTPRFSRPRIYLCRQLPPSTGWETGCIPAEDSRLKICSNRPIRPPRDVRVSRSVLPASIPVRLADDSRLAGLGLSVSSSRGQVNLSSDSTSAVYFLDFGKLGMEVVLVESL